MEELQKTSEKAEDRQGGIGFGTEATGVRAGNPTAALHEDGIVGCEYGAERSSTWNGPTVGCEAQSGGVAELVKQGGSVMELGVTQQGRLPRVELLDKVIPGIVQGWSRRLSGVTVLAKSSGKQEVFPVRPRGGVGLKEFSPYVEGFRAWFRLIGPQQRKLFIYNP